MNITNIKKTIRYCKKNGFLQAVYAVCEKISERKQRPYQFYPTSNEILEKQRNEKWHKHYKISIVVPAFETKEEYLKAMIESVLEQSYMNLELVIADASDSLKVQEVVSMFKDNRIIYQKLETNLGISENTNQALLLSTGDYIGLLDHDDVLTKDAIYEVVKSIEKKQKEGIPVIMVYSDEDKTDEYGTKYFDPHFKEDFNLDLLLSNNYICHFTVIESNLLKKLKFRKEFDGAQDYDMILRTVEAAKEDSRRIIHINKVLYHWRCHSQSTAENPTSKMYAYEAGKKAIVAFLKEKGWQGNVTHTKHLGFYRITYSSPIWNVRDNIAAVGGPIVKGNTIISGAMNRKGKPLYGCLCKHYSGYMKKASLQQQVEVLDIRNINVSPACFEIYEEVLKLFGLGQVSIDIITNANMDNDNIKIGNANTNTNTNKNKNTNTNKNKNTNKNRNDSKNWKPSEINETSKHMEASIEFAKRVSEKGYFLIYDPAE